MWNLLAQTNAGDAAANAGLMAAMMANMMINLVVFVILYAVYGYALSTLAKKTGTPNEVWAWIPILNIVLLLQIAQLEVWYIIGFFIPCVNFATLVYVWWKVCERRGKPGALALLNLVPCLNFFFPLYIALVD